MENEAEKHYKYLVNARNYHYAQFNIWMGFFIVIVGASFFAYGKLMEMETGMKMEMEMETGIGMKMGMEICKGKLFFEKTLVIVFGYIISLLFHLSSKGYYYWITNFITLITNHEESNMDIEYRVYSVFANKDANNNYFLPTFGANISTSKIVCVLSYLLTFPWGILFFHNFEFPCQELPFCSFLKITIAVIFVFMANLLFILIAKGLLYSSIDGHSDLKIGGKK